MNESGFKSLQNLGRLSKDTQFHHTKFQYPAIWAWLQGRPYRPFRLPLEELKEIVLTFRKGGINE